MGRKVQIEVEELSEVELNFISLVKRGANQSPFRIIKNDELPSAEAVAKMVGRGAPETGDPKVAAIFVNADIDGRIRPLIEKRGFDSSKRREDGGVVVYGQGVLEDGKPYGSLVSLGDGVGVALDSVSKEFLYWRSESTDFDEQLSQIGYMGNLWTATEAFVTTVRNNLDDAVDSEEAAARIQAVIAAFGRYVTAITKALPDAAFLLIGDIAKSAGVERGSLARNEHQKKDSDVTKVPETAAGDLDDLNVVKTDAAKPADTKPEVAKTVNRILPSMVGGELVKREATFEVSGDGTETMIGFVAEKLTKTQRVAVGGKPVDAEYEYAMVDGEEVFVRFVDEGVQKAMADGAAPAIPSKPKAPVDGGASGDSADNTLASALGEFAKAVVEGNAQTRELLKQVVAKADKPTATVRVEDTDAALGTMGGQIRKVAKSSEAGRGLWDDSALVNLTL